MHRNLVEYLHHIDLGEEATTRQVVGIIVDVTDRIAVGPVCFGGRDAMRPLS
jgi:hypothetical protein